VAVGVLVGAGVGVEIKEQDATRENSKQITTNNVMWFFIFPPEVLNFSLILQ
jgi:hypothetical protein